MTKAISFAPLQAGLTRAAHEGTAQAAGQIAEILRGQGEAASVQTAPDGTAQIVLEGAATVAREFGTQSVPARGAAGAVVQANRPDIRETIARKLSEALRGARR